MTIENDDKWINLEDAADYLSVNKNTIRNWIRNDKGIPAYKIGKLWNFKKSELDERVQRYMNTGKRFQMGRLEHMFLDDTP